MYRCFDILARFLSFRLVPYKNVIFEESLKLIGASMPLKTVNLFTKLLNAFDLAIYLLHPGDTFANL